MSTQATGPRSEAGKERAAMNAVKHGLRAQTIVLPHENADDWEALRRATQQQYRPCGLVEKELVERIAVSLWRLRRVALYEVEAWEAEDRDKALARVIRYEAHLSRQLNQALKLLLDEQENRPTRGITQPDEPRSRTEEGSSFGKKASGRPAESSFGKKASEPAEESSFGTTAAPTPEESSFGARAEAVIAKRLLEMIELDRRVNGHKSTPGLVPVGQEPCSAVS